MAKLSQKYESMAVFKGSLEEDKINALRDKFKDFISKNGSDVELDEWGKRRLAYSIDDETEGYYFLYTFESKPDFVSELDRIYQITDGVLRSMTVALKS